MSDGGGDRAAGKRKREYRIITRDTAEAIEKVRVYFEGEARSNSRAKVTRPLERTADCFDITSKTVIEVRKKLQNDVPFVDEETRERAMEVPLSFAGVVRSAINAIQANKQRVTVDVILRHLELRPNTRSSGWKWSRTTLYRFLTDKMNYTYGKRRSYYDELRENVTIAAQRIEYIKRIQQYRAEGRPIYYQDESWVNKNMTPDYVWMVTEA